MTLKEIEQYLKILQKEELDFKLHSGTESSNTLTVRTDTKLRMKAILFMIRSLAEYFLLLIKISFIPSFTKDKRIVYTSKNLCTEVNGILEDRIVKYLFTDNLIFVNHQKNQYIHKINDSKVYNIGGVVNLLRLCTNRKRSGLMRTFLAYRLVNDSIVKRLNGNEVFTLCFYDLNGLSLAYSNHRDRMRLCEVQHGSIINYPPYVKPSPIQIADVFCVKNQPTIDYLKNHLCQHYDPEYRLIPYPKGNWEYVPGIHLLYASTVEFNGLHPVFREFLDQNKDEDLHVIVRLHPREREKEELFRGQLSKYVVNFEFDRSKNWLDGNRIENLIVVSPWSSTIEDAYDNGLTTIIIDPVGKARYAHLIEGEYCVYSDDLTSTLAGLSCEESAE